MMTHLFVVLLFLKQKDIEGKDCTAVEPIRNYTFNLAGLRSSMNLHISSSDQPEKFFFNVCGPPSVNCNNKKVAACVKAPSGKEMTFGELVIVNC